MLPDNDEWSGSSHEHERTYDGPQTLQRNDAPVFYAFNPLKYNRDGTTRLPLARSTSNSNTSSLEKERVKNFKVEKLTAEEVKQKSVATSNSPSSKPSFSGLWKTTETFGELTSEEKSQRDDMIRKSPISPQFSSNAQRKAYNQRFNLKAFRERLSSGLTDNTNHQEQPQEWQHLRSLGPRPENSEVDRIKALAARLKEIKTTKEEHQHNTGEFVSLNDQQRNSEHSKTEEDWKKPVQETGRSSLWNGQADEAQSRRSRYNKIEKKCKKQVLEKGHSSMWNGKIDEAQPRRSGLHDRGRKGRRHTEGMRFQRDEGDEATEENEADDESFEIQRKRQRKLEKAQKKARRSATPILLPEYISINSLARALRIRIEEFTNKLVELGFKELGSEHIIDAETAGLIASEFNFDPVLPKPSSSKDIVALPPTEDASLLSPRPPVITIMGHVDHGKTTLLDWLRKSSVVASEHGGITQHIGAFTVSMPSGRIITFLDTPGHAAFLDMRARGANVTDIVILVVAADDSVKPQTIEAIKHAKAAKVPIIVAINKIDKEGANPERVKQDLARHGIDVEDFGGDTQTVCVSGKTGQGMEDLENAAIALADILDVRADPTGRVEGWILEATMKKSGRVATVLVRRGTLELGTVLVAGQTWARVRSLRNEAGATVRSAGPGTPVEVDGWRDQPEAGAEVLQAPNEQRAREVVDLRVENVKSARTAGDVTSLNKTRKADELRRQRESSRKNDVNGSEEESQSSRLLEIPFILRADVSGSVEALEAAVLSLGNSEVRARVLRTAVGPLSPSDVEHAAIMKGNLVSFNMPIDNSIVQQAEKQGVKVLDDNVIYRLVDEVKGLLEEQLAPSVTSRVTGEAEVAQVFEISFQGGKVPVAGCRVRNGVMKKGSNVKIFRNGETIYDGKSLSASYDSLRCPAFHPTIIEFLRRLNTQFFVYAHSWSTTPWNTRYTLKL